jgi:hypothetical protein
VIVISNLPLSHASALKAAGAADYIQKSRLFEDQQGENAFLSTISEILHEPEAWSEKKADDTSKTSNRDLSKGASNTGQS